MCWNKPCRTQFYAELPPGGVPGVKPGSLVQILGNVYGANDAPANWYHEFDKVATSVGFTKSKFDSCLYLCFNSEGQLQGVLGAHVDDTITGGDGEAYLSAIAQLKSQVSFPKMAHRLWRIFGNSILSRPEYFRDHVSTTRLCREHSTY